MENRPYYNNNRNSNIILNVAEKPSVAREVSTILSGNNFRREVNIINLKILYLN